MFKILYGSVAVIIKSEWKANKTTFGITAGLIAVVILGTIAMVIHYA